MNRSKRHRLLRDRIERGEYTPKTGLLPAAERVGLQSSKAYRKEITEAYIADVYQRSRLPPKVRDPQWGFHTASAKKTPRILTES